MRPPSGWKRWGLHDGGALLAVMRNHSFAGSDSGIKDADQITVHRVTADDCPHDRCKYEDVHIVVEWNGDDYDRHNSWIAFKGNGIVSLDDLE